MPRIFENCKIDATLPVFTFGVSSYSCWSNYVRAGTYTKADLAAALIYMQCDQLVHLAANVARIHRLSSIVFVGSYSVWPLTQRLIQECFLRAALLLPLIGVR